MSERVVASVPGIDASATLREKLQKLRRGCWKNLLLGSAGNHATKRSDNLMCCDTNIVLIKHDMRGTLETIDMKLRLLSGETSPDFW